jgi:hypothetical protein
MSHPVDCCVVTQRQAFVKSKGGYKIYIFLRRCAGTQYVRYCRQLRAMLRCELILKRELPFVMFCLVSSLSDISKSDKYSFADRWMNWTLVPPKLHPLSLMLPISTRPSQTITTVRTKCGRCPVSMLVVLSINFLDSCSSRQVSSRRENVSHLIIHFANCSSGRFLRQIRPIIRAYMFSSPSGKVTSMIVLMRFSEVRAIEFR